MDNAAFSFSQADITRKSKKDMPTAHMEWLPCQYYLQRQQKVKSPCSKQELQS